tara:strand:+ start:838 stop:939 length:102 start_codon:yes stop_codon:yes gene_type:complete
LIIDADIREVEKAKKKYDIISNGKGDLLDDLNT